MEKWGGWENWGGQIKWKEGQDENKRRNMGGGTTTNTKDHYAVL